jgi:hypothetical protein
VILLSGLSSSNLYKNYIPFVDMCGNEFFKGCFYHFGKVDLKSGKFLILGQWLVFGVPITSNILNTCSI